MGTTPETGAAERARGDWEGPLLELAGDAIPGVPGRPAGTWPFGTKHNGHTAPEVLADEDYCRWLLRERRDWLAADWPQILSFLLEHFPDPPARPLEFVRAVPPRDTARYEYRDEGGELRYTVVRLEPKGFRVEMPDGAEVSRAAMKRAGILYRLPELTALPPGSTVLACEGEEDAETVAALGLNSTTAPFGAAPKGLGWLPQYTPCLAGFHVVVVPDADGPGRRHAGAVTEALQGAALSVVTCDLHEGKRGPWDVSDWLGRRGRGRAGLETAVARARFAAAGREWRKAGPNRDEREDLIRSSRLAHTLTDVLLAAAYLMHWRDGVAWPYAREIAAAAKVTRQTAQDAVTGLRRAGIVAPDGRVAWDVLAVS